MNPKFDLTADMRVRPELLGLEALLVPFLQHVSSQRITMFASNITQQLVLDGCEQPMIASGWEQKFAKYEFDYTTRDEDIQIIAIIPKFKTNVGARPIPTFPSLTVIYLGCTTKKIGYFEMSRYMSQHDGFGYMYKWLNTHQLKPNMLIPKDMKFTTSPAIDRNFYMQGVNANVAHMAMWDSTEDAFVISKSLQKKLRHSAIATLKVNIPEKAIPLNLYGTESEFSIMPDIGSVVKDDGIVVGLRHHSDETLMDLTDQELMTPEYMHDELFHAIPGAEIIDVQVFIAPAALKRIKQCRAYDQLVKYQEQHYAYYESVINVYKEVKDSYQLSSEFNNLVTRCMSLSQKQLSRNAVKLMNKKELVEFIHLKITYHWKREVSKGFKLTGRDGMKGVVSDVREDEDMPIDDLGFRADLIVSPESGFNRLTISPFFEQFFNRTSTIIQQRIIQGTIPHDQAYEYVLGYLNDVRPAYANLVRALTAQDKDSFIEHVKEKGIYLVISPFLDVDFSDLILMIAEKYNIVKTPVTFTQHLDGESFKVRTNEPVMIGSKFLFLLGKLPEAQLNVIEAGFVNQFSTPTKPGGKVKEQCMFGQTPIRLGEDEICLLTMSLGPKTVARLMGINAASPKAQLELQRRLSTDRYPTRLEHIDMTTDEIIRTNNNISLMIHELGAAGIGYHDASVKPNDQEKGI